MPVIVIIIYNRAVSLCRLNLLHFFFFFLLTISYGGTTYDQQFY